MIGYVYGLKERDTYEFRYVGITRVSLPRRLSQHKYSAKSGHRYPVYNWMRSASNVDIVELECLEFDDLHELLARETVWIDNLSEENRLLNLVVYGETDHNHTLEVGLHIGKLRLVSPVVSRNRSYWVCECDCGKSSKILSYNLKNGNSKSCGKCKSGTFCVEKECSNIRYQKHQRCSTHVMRLHRYGSADAPVFEKRYVDLTGDRYGTLIVKRRLSDGKWLCECDCGGTRETFLWNLRNTGDKSTCGNRVSHPVWNKSKV